MANHDESFFEGPYERQRRSLDHAKGLVAKDVTIGKKAFLRYVTGSIENTSGHKFSYLVVNIDLFDANGSSLGNVGDGVQNFDPGQTWNFEAGFSREGVVTAKVSEIKGWL